jgi:putative zinc finger protein
MSCSPFDLKEYFLEELPVPQAARVEAHVNSCPACREELDRLRLTGAALFSLRDEEIPQRIAFVSDKIFEPSRARRWFAALWGSAARLGFASAALLSAAIVFHAFIKPAPALVPGPAVASMAAVGPSQEEIQARVDAAVASAVDRAMTQSEKTRQLVANLTRANEEARAQLVRAAGQIEMFQAHERRNRFAGMTPPPLESGDRQ